MPHVRRILETCINVESVPLARDWYQRVFDFEILQTDDRFCAFNVGSQDVLLLFKIGESKQPVQLPGGIIPPHNTEGATHLAFGIPEDELKDWLTRLKELSIDIE